MFLNSLPRRAATAVRLAALALIALGVWSGPHPPGTAGRGLVVSLLFAAAVAAWLVWTARPDADSVTLELYVLALAGGMLVEASSQGAASAFVFVSVIAAGARVDLVRAAPVAVAGTVAIGLGALLYHGSGLGVVAYALGLAASLLAASTARQRVIRTEQAELLLAQTQRSHEEQLRAARLEESARIAREIHDVLAHTLAGLAIQLEATTALLDQGADPDTLRSRVQRAHQLTREGLQETRRAVGALRGETVSTAAAIEGLVSEYRATTDAKAELTIDGDPARLGGPAGQAMLRVVQEALTNVRKHAPGAEVSVAVQAGEAPDDELVVVVADHPTAVQPNRPHNALSGTGSGYGVQGMRERAELLGGSLTAGPAHDGWRVELRLPARGAGLGAAISHPPMTREEVR